MICISYEQQSQPIENFDLEGAASVKKKTVYIHVNLWIECNTMFIWYYLDNSN